MPGLPLVAASGGHSSSRCADLSLSRPLPLRSTGSRRAGSATVAHGPSCSAACGILPDQGSNLCLLHWQADSQPLRHQGSPAVLFFKQKFVNLQCPLGKRQHLRCHKKPLCYWMTVLGQDPLIVSYQMLQSGYFRTSSSETSGREQVMQFGDSLQSNVTRIG